MREVQVGLAHLIEAHVLEGLDAVADGTVDLAMTSPPYWNLRDYQTSPQIWPDGLQLCSEHDWEYKIKPANSGSLNSYKQQTKGTKNYSIVPAKKHATCRVCGAWLGELGAEPTPELYVEHLARIFHKVYPKLKPTGLLCLNLGNSYRKKQLILVSAMVALALQKDGWILRNDVVWHKPNAMTNPVKDRFGSSHEFIFVFSKTRKSFFDYIAVEEPLKHPRAKSRNATNKHGGYGNKTYTGFKYDASEVGSKRKRDVWTVTTRGFKGAHFATYNVPLIEPCILAGTSAGGCCPECGAPYKRVIEKGKPDKKWQAACGADANGEYTGQAVKDYESHKAQNASDVKRRILAGMKSKKTVDWVPSCKHEKFLHVERQRPVVLDIFNGSGTTGEAAVQYGCEYIGIDLFPANIDMSIERLENVKLKRRP